MTIKEATERVMEQARALGRMPEVLHVPRHEAEELARDWLGTIPPGYSDDSSRAVGDFLAGRGITTIMGVPVVIQG